MKEENENIKKKTNPSIFLKYKGEFGDWLEKNENTDLFLTNLKTIKVSENLKIVGDQSRYQFYVSFILALTFLTMGFLYCLLAYTYYVPEFHCIKNNLTYKCSQKEACDLGNFEIVKTRTSLITDFKMYCGKKKLYVTSSQSFIFIFAAIGTFFVALISDKIGRRNCFFIMIFCAILGGVLSIFSKTLFFIIFGVLLLWTSLDIFFSISLIYLNEISSDYFRSKIPVFFVIAAIGSICINFILVHIPSYKGYFIFCFCFILTFSVFYSKVISSPFFVFSTGNLKKYYDVLMEISDFNKNDHTQKQIELENSLQFKKIVYKEISKIEKLKIDKIEINFTKKILSTLKIIFSKKYLLKIICCMVFYASMYINQCVVIIMPQKLGIENIYVMNTLLNISDLLGYLLILPFSHTLKRRKVNIICNICVIIGALLLLLNEENKGTDKYSIIATILSCFLKMINSATYSLAFNYISELFPTKIRGLATGLIVCTGRISNCFASTFEHFSTIYDIHPLILCAVPAILALPASILLPETANKALIN